MTIFEILESWKRGGDGRGWELRSLASGHYLVALFDGNRFICDGKWNTPDGAFHGAHQRWLMSERLDSRGSVMITCADKETYTNSVS